MEKLSNGHNLETEKGGTPILARDASSYYLIHIPVKLHEDMRTCTMSEIWSVQECKYQKKH